MNEPGLRTENLFRLSWPIFLQNLAHTVVLLVDLWFFSHLADEVAATIGQLMPIIWLGAFVIPVFAGTGVSVASQFMGAKQYARVVPAYMMNLALTVSMSVAFGAALRIFAPEIGHWMGLNPSLSEVATVYLGTMSGYFLFMGVLVSYNAVLSSRGMTHWLMYSSFLLAGVNLALASLFVFGFGWGLRGIVLASILGVATAMALSVWLVHVKLKVRFYLRGAARDMLGVLRPMMQIGVANAFEPFSYAVQQIIVSTMIIGLGVVPMAANSYAARAQMLQITFSLVLALGSQILMAHWMGARRFDDVDRLYWKAIRLSTTVAGTYAFVLWLFSDLVLGIFTRDESVKNLGNTLLLIAIFLEPARAVNIVGGFTLKTVGDARFPLVIAILFMWGILPIVFFLDRAWGLSLAGFWICFAADEIIRAGINLWRWRTGRWRSFGIASDTRRASSQELQESIEQPTR